MLEEGSRRSDPERVIGSRWFSERLHFVKVLKASRQQFRGDGREAVQDEPFQCPRKSGLRQIKVKVKPLSHVNTFHHSNQAKG